MQVKQETELAPRIWANASCGQRTYNNKKEDIWMDPLEWLVGRWPVSKAAVLSEATNKVWYTTHSSIRSVTHTVE